MRQALQPLHERVLLDALPSSTLSTHGRLSHPGAMGLCASPPHEPRGRNRPSGRHRSANRPLPVPVACLSRGGKVIHSGRCCPCRTERGPRIESPTASWLREPTPTKRVLDRSAESTLERVSPDQGHDHVRGRPPVLTGSYDHSCDQPGVGLAWRRAGYLKGLSSASSRPVRYRARTGTTEHSKSAPDDETTSRFADARILDGWFKPAVPLICLRAARESR
jgi:hypothetical protein